MVGGVALAFGWMATHLVAWPIRRQAAGAFARARRAGGVRIQDEYFNSIASGADADARLALGAFGLWRSAAPRPC